MARLLDQVQAAAQVRVYSPHTVAAYRAWVASYVRFHGLRHPRELDAEAVLVFLAHVARDHAPSTINQAHAALVFLYASVLRVEPDGLREIPWARGPRRVPVVLTRPEVGVLLSTLGGTSRLIAALLYGTGLRISEGLGLRVKDLGSEKTTPRYGIGRPDSPDFLGSVRQARQHRLELSEYRY